LRIGATLGRCSEAARALCSEPAGSVDGVESLLLVEWPRPWPRDAANVEEFGELVDAIDQYRRFGREVRLQLIAALDESDSDRHVVKLFRRPKQWFAGFASDERLVPRRNVVDTALDLLRSDSTSLTGASQGSPVDVLICSHGTRDVCCGSSGTKLARRFSVPSDVRVWTSSHLGGHRYAPTAALLPAGTVWGYLDDDLLHQAVAGEMDEDGVRRAYRGNFGCHHPVGHIAEREAVIRFGFGWLRYERHLDISGEHGGRDDDLVEARLRYRSPGGDDSGVIIVAAQRVRIGELAPCRAVGPLSPEFNWRLHTFELDGPHTTQNHP
jgi:hypothetical protein